jgi:hypothetical protein
VKLLATLSLSGVLCAALLAVKICALVKIAVFFCPAREAIAVNQARNLKRIKSARIFATGFRSTKNTELKLSGKKAKKRMRAKLRLITYLINYG